MQSSDRLRQAVEAVFRALEPNQDEAEMLVFVANEGYYWGYSFFVDLNNMAFSFSLVEENCKWCPANPCAGFEEGDLVCWTEVVYKTARKGLSEKQLARLLYAYLAKFAIVQTLPQDAWSDLREMALGK